MQFFFCLRRNVFSALGVSTSFLSKAFFPIVLLSLASEKSILLFAEQHNPFSNLLYRLLSRIEKNLGFITCWHSGSCFKADNCCYTSPRQVLSYGGKYQTGLTPPDFSQQGWIERKEPPPLKERPPPQFTGNSHPNAV